MPGPRHYLIYMIASHALCVRLPRRLLQSAPTLPARALYVHLASAAFELCPCTVFIGSLDWHAIVMRRPCFLLSYLYNRLAKAHARAAAALYTSLLVYIYRRTPRDYASLRTYIYARAAAVALCRHRVALYNLGFLCHLLPRFLHSASAPSLPPALRPRLRGRLLTIPVLHVLHALYLVRCY